VTATKYPDSNQMKDGEDRYDEYRKKEHKD